MHKRKISIRSTKLCKTTKGGSPGHPGLFLNGYRINHWLNRTRS
nr:MAG TPA: hypothetical protein [Microviridae sp.]